MTENDVTCPHMTGSDLEVLSFGSKSPGSGCRRHRTHVLCTFELLQGCNSQEVQARNRKRHHVT